MKIRAHKTYIVALVLFCCMLLVNTLATTTSLLGGVTTRDVSETYPNLFTPASFTFSIWSVIYLLLIGFLVRVFGLIKPKAPRVGDDVARRVVFWFSLTSMMNVLWLFFWHYRVIELSVLFILLLMTCLIKIHGLLSRQKMSFAERMVVRAPFSIYFGWVTVAAVANISILLSSSGWQGGGISADAWVTIMLTVGAILSLVVGIGRKDPLYMVVFAWAYAGILAQHMSPRGYDGAYQSVITFVPFMIVVLLLASLSVVAQYYSKKRSIFGK